MRDRDRVRESRQKNEKPMGEMTEKEGEKRGDRRDKVEREAESELRKGNWYKEGKRKRETERKRKKGRKKPGSFRTCYLKI